MWRSIFGDSRITAARAAQSRFRMPETATARRAMLQIEVSMIFVHRANIERYKKLLATALSAEERRVIECQMSTEEAALSKLTRNAL